MNLTAVTRDVSPAIQQCELTHLDRVPIDLERAVEQHQSYRALLKSLGAGVPLLPALPEYPDSVFVEDVAVVVDEVAVLTRPGAPSRRGEVPLMEPVLAAHREIKRIEPEGTLDGGDVLVLGKEVVVGISGRTNREGLEQFQTILSPWGYRVRGCEVSGCLHLKSAVTAVTDHAVLLNPCWVDPLVFASYERIDIDPSEPAAANILRVGDQTVYSTVYPRTLEKLRRAGYEPHCIDNSEMVKAEGALTCCSLIFVAQESGANFRI